MRTLTRSLAVLAAVGFVAVAVSSVWAGSPGSPDIPDSSGDVAFQGRTETTMLQGQALEDSVDITGIWFKFANASTLTVGVKVAGLNGQNLDENLPSQGSLTFNVKYQFHRPPAPNVSGLSEIKAKEFTTTISTELDGDAAASCGGTASRDNGAGTLTCGLNSSTFVGGQLNGTFYDGDMIMYDANLTSTSEGTYGQASANDSAAASGSGAVIASGIKARPAPDQDGGGGGGNGGDGDGGGGGNTTGDGPSGESTPGFASVVAVASLIAVALWARERD